MSLVFAYNTNGFAHHTLDDCLRILADLGYGGVALSLDVHHLNPFSVTPRELADLGQTLERLDLRVAVETGARYLLDPLRKHHPSLLSSDGWGRRMRLLERSIEIASEIGASVVTFASGRQEEGTSADQQWDLLAERCDRLVARAACQGVTLGLEPEPGMFVGDLEGYRRLRQRLAEGSPALTLDIGHVHLSEPGPIEGWIVEHGAEICHVHVEDMRRPVHRHLAIGEGEVEFAPVLRALLDIRLGGLVSLELSRDSHRAPEVARSGLRALEAALAGG